ncbi:F510_1955 family glycosylhydrolase [Halobacillus litoralis]|uniref:F510_1955 family glycosylhydrolase n=1 Tax=Halobacillus litoralis TaxID=45668 RepID=UPI001CFE2CFD|nr:hypothetical protein [Halobacillus litoralis]
MKVKFMLIAMAALATMAGCSGQSEGTESNSKDTGEESLQAVTESFNGSLEHVHGIGYIDEETIAYAAHSGIKLYQDGEWLESTYHKNDYMGFNVVDNGFYTSGHPGGESDLPNPIGLQKGEITEERLSALAFEGESDFHVMGVGARNHTVYVLNEHPNSEMEKGLYKTTNDGKDWEEIAAENLGGKIYQVAVHPDDENVLAAAGSKGIYLSEDGGETFTMISEQGQGSGLYFTKDRLYYGLYTGEPSLNVYNWKDQSKEEIKLPELKDDAVLYFSKNPDAGDELVLFTIKGSSYVTSDSGETWEQIIDQGKIK